MIEYNKIQLGKIAQQYGFGRDTFEKVLRLKEILKHFNTEPYLKEHLVLKGGTAINMVIFNLPRLSVDPGLALVSMHFIISIETQLETRIILRLN